MENPPVAFVSMIGRKAGVKQSHWKANTTHHNTMRHSIAGASVSGSLPLNSYMGGNNNPSTLQSPGGQ